MAKSNNEPYKALGAKIKHLRQQWKQSLGDVSGSLEIEEALLKEIESGKTLPPLELLNMLISHFLLSDEQAEELRQLAALQHAHTTDALIGGLEDLIMKQIVMYLPLDNRIVYTDKMNATVNKNGVVLQFFQNSGQNGQSMPISQVGMSREHAEKVIEVLKKTLEEYDRNQKPKLLPEKSSDNE